MVLLRMTDIVVSSLQLELRTTGNQNSAQKQAHAVGGGNLTQLHESDTMLEIYRHASNRLSHKAATTLHTLKGWLTCNSRALHPVAEHSAANTVQPIYCASEHLQGRGRQCCVHVSVDVHMTTP